MTSTTTRFADPLHEGMQGMPRGRAENPFADAKQAARERSVSTSRETNEKLMALIQEQSALIKAQSATISSLESRVKVLESRCTTTEQLLQGQNTCLKGEIGALKNLSGQKFEAVGIQISEVTQQLSVVKAVADTASHRALYHTHEYLLGRAIV
jgi:hypothetical protein